MFTLPRFRNTLEATLSATGVGPDASVCVALSGGLDSTVLLVALAQLRRESTRAFAGLRALHVDHGLHPDSAQWSAACQRLCSAHEVAFTSLRVNAAAGRGHSPEAAARQARYDALRAAITHDEVLLTAHQADDQLETVLLQWLRGGGLRAVAGMERAVRFGTAGAWLGRPLLEFTRADLAQWARAEGLEWVEDPANADLRYDRNYLRHEVLPAVRRRWPAAPHTIARVAEFAADALDLEREVAVADLAARVRGSALDLTGWAELPDARQRALVRAWLSSLGLPVPPSRTLAGWIRDLTVAAPDRNPEARWAGAVVRRYRDRLYAERPSATAVHESDWILTDSGLGSSGRDPVAAAPTVPSRYAWTEHSSLELVPAIGQGLSRARCPSRLVVRRRAGGEQFRSSGSLHRCDLRKWLQQHDVLPWRRSELPLLYEPSGTRSLVAVADLACDAHYAARPDEPSWRVVWHGRGAVTASDVEGMRLLNWREHPPIG